MTRWREADWLFCALLCVACSGVTAALSISLTLRAADRMADAALAIEVDTASVQIGEPVRTTGEQRCVRWWHSDGGYYFECNYGSEPDR